MRRGVEERLPIAFGQDAIVEHGDNAGVGGRANESSDALPEFH